jgi:hypothetical protein
MSDSKSSYGEPVEEPTSDDDVVGRAEEGLADAEAAGRDATSGESVADTEPPAPEPAPVVEPEPYADDEVTSAADYLAAYGASEQTEVIAPVVTPSEPVVAPAVVAPAVATTQFAPQPIFVQAPEAPNPRGNRAAAGAIGVVAALAFAVLYLAAWLGFGALAGDVTVDNVVETALGALGTWSLWVTVVSFFIAFWLLGAIINRGRWGAWVVFGILVGVAAYAGHILGALFQAPFWELTASQGGDLIEKELLTPLAIAAFVIGRELTIWFGAWAAARGKRVTELNVEAQREYERTLEAGPQLVRA